MAQVGKTTININGIPFDLKVNPELQESGFVVEEKIVGTTGVHGDKEIFVVGEATNVIITRQKETDITALQAIRDGDVVFGLADGSKFNMEKAAVIGAIKYNSENGEATLESIQANNAYYVV